MKNQRKTISTEDKLDVISWLAKCERIVDICHNVRLAHSSVRTVGDNADRIIKSARSETEVFVLQTTTDLPEW